ncbi:MAG: VWA domain-containing protein, partial [Spirochaetales bacterium]
MKAPPRSGFFFSAENRFLSFFPLGLFTVFCLLGLSGISFQKEVKSSSYARTDVAILLDVSRSMLARDAEPARLGKAKQICLDLINGFPARYSLTVFKGAAVTLVPLTEDASALAEGLRFSGPSVLTPPGTDIAGALAAAAGTHASRDGAKKILLLLSDGETVRESGEPGEIPVP